MKLHRQERVAAVVRKVVSDAISRKLNDPRISNLASVTRVDVTADLEHARVWVSVIGESSAGKRTLAGLKSASGPIQRMVAEELHIRRCPRVSFELDESLRRSAETIRLIEQYAAEYRSESGELSDEATDTGGPSERSSGENS